MINKFYLILPLLFTAVAALAQNGTIKGHVTDNASRESLPAAYVLLDGQNKGASTDAFGNYQLNNLKPGKYKVKLNYVGFNEFEKEVTVGSGETVVLNISLSASTSDLKQVNVYGKLNYR